MFYDEYIYIGTICIYNIYLYVLYLLVPRALHLMRRYCAVIEECSVHRSVTSRFRFGSGVFEGPIRASRIFPQVMEHAILNDFFLFTNSVT